MIYTAERLTKDRVFELLMRCNNSFSPPLSQNIPYTIEEYASKLANNASFIVCSEKGSVVGFVAYYINLDGRFAYIPQIWVSDDHQRQGIGSSMIEELIRNSPIEIQYIRLEVRRSNNKAFAFYLKSNYHVIEEYNGKCLMEMLIEKK